MKGTAELLIRAIALGFVKAVLVSSIFNCISSYAVYGKAGGTGGEGLLFFMLLFPLGNSWKSVTCCKASRAVATKHYPANTQLCL